MRKAYLTFEAEGSKLSLKPESISGVWSSFDEAFKYLNDKYILSEPKRNDYYFKDGYTENQTGRHCSVMILEVDMNKDIQKELN